jgi:iron complex outermembrane receptor protein
LKNVAPGWSSSVLPYVEKMEVIKGPASALFGNTDPGGTVNMITKKPLKQAQKSINFSTGSFNTLRLMSDFTGPVDTAGKFLYRLNMAYQDAGSFRNLQGGEDFVIAPSFSFIPSENTRVNFEVVYTKGNSRLDRGQPIFGATATSDNSILYSTPISFAIGKDNDYLHETNLFSTVSIQQKISKKFSLNASYMKAVYKEDLFEHRTSNRYAVDADGNSIPTLMEMRTTKRVTTTYTDNLSVYGVYELQTGKVSHKILIGYDYMQNVLPLTNNSANNANGYRNAENTGSIARYNPAKKEDYLIVDNMPVPNVPHFNLTNPDYSISDISKYINIPQINENTPSKYFVNGFYIQDQIKWKKFQMLLGLRKEYYNDVINNGEKDEQRVQQTAFIPRVGLVYSILENISAYGTYAKGYQPQGAAIVGSTAIYGGPFDPLKSNILEFGVKSELFQQRLMLTASVYKIQQDNILVNAGDDDNPDKLRQLGQEQSKGFELDASGAITSALSLIANFSYNEAKITKSDIATEIGVQMPNAPRVQGNIWAKYKINAGTLKGIGVALGGNYVGERNTLAATLQLPSYILANAGLFYTINKFRMAANFNNIFNKIHWVGGYDYVRLFPGTPRNFMLSVGYML